ncbi:MAG: hypothetical protein ACI9TH_002441 [Kiritimatiellia bacterium]|jgi:hypothetical protein
MKYGLLWVLTIGWMGLHPAWSQTPEAPAAETQLAIDLGALLADLDAPKFQTRQEAERLLRNLPSERLSELEARLDPSAPEQRNSILRAINYIKDHGPQGVRTLTDQALDVSLTTAQRKEAFQKLALLICEGDTTAIKALSGLSTRLNATANTPDATRIRVENMNNMRSAFNIMGNAAGQDNQHAITALVVAARVPTMRSYAPDALGQAAAKGSAKALEILTDPTKFGLNASSTILALQPAIAQNNAAAIKALQGMVEKPGNAGLHYLIATALQTAAAQNNQGAVDALTYIVENNTSSSTLRRALDGLKLASNRGNEKAKGLVQTWEPKVTQMQKNGVRARATTTIRIGPNPQVVEPKK